jgi:methyltransferase family protein
MQMKPGLYEMFLAHTGKNLDKWHHYFPIYERYFAKFRGGPVSILEIGVDKGGSLELWWEYFRPDAQIIGIDINPTCSAFNDPARNTCVYIGDQSDAAFLRTIADWHGPFDIIIDDGGHYVAQQKVSFETLYPHVKDGGVYLVEDLHTNLWPGRRVQGETFLQLAARYAQDLTAWHQEQMSLVRYSTPPEARVGPATDTPGITKTTTSIAFFDSVVVFEKHAVAEPYREVR